MSGGMSACVRGGANRALPRSDRGRRPSPAARTLASLRSTAKARRCSATPSAPRCAPRRGVEHWYLKVIDSLAPTGKVGTLSIEGLGWGEVDFLNDIEVATKLTDGWV